MGYKLLVVVTIIVFAFACSKETNPVYTGDNDAPVIQAITFIPDTILAGESCLVKCTAFDANNDPLSYEWETVGNIAGKGESVYYTPNSCCSEPRIRLTVKDQKGGIFDTLFTVPFLYD